MPEVQVAGGSVARKTRGHVRPARADFAGEKDLEECPPAAQELRRKIRRRLAARIRCVLLCAALIMPGSGAAAFDELSPDMGTADSPLAEGWLRLGASGSYSQQRGFGWEKPPQSAFSRDRRRQQWCCGKSTGRMPTARTDPTATRC